MRKHAAAPRRIVRIVTRLNIGGPAIHAALLSNQLDPQQFSTTLVVGQPEATEGDFSGLLDGTRARLIRIPNLRRPLRPWADLRALVACARILWQARPAIIHTHMAKAGALGRLAGFLYNRVGPGRIPAQRAVIIHTFHGHVLEGYFSRWASRIFLLIERWLARHTDCLIAVSPLIREELLKRGIGRPEQIRVIPLGLELSRLTALMPPMRAEHFRCGFVGRLVPIKNPALFLDGLSRLQPRLAAQRVQGMIVGDGPLRGQLEEDARRRGLTEHVRFTGWQRDVAACYAEVDVLCLTSWNEGTPVAVIEALAAGRAVVATDVGGVRDVLGPGTNGEASIAVGGYAQAPRGLLVRPGDAEGLAAALEALAGNESLRQQLAGAGRSYVVKTFGASRLLSDIAALYTELCREGTCTH